MSAVGGKLPFAASARLIASIPKADLQMHEVRVPLLRSGPSFFMTFDDVAVAIVPTKSIAQI